MQFKLLALSAFAAAVSAQSSSGSTLNQASVYAVLATALPSSLIAEALTNPGAVSSEIASEFSAGTTPTWFTALPTPIQTYLLGQAGSNATGVLNSTVAANGTHSRTTATMKTTGKTTHLTGVVHHTTGNGHNTATTGAAASSAAAASSGSSSSSSGGASMPTNIIGAGIAGAVGLVGLFAL